MNIRALRSTTLTSTLLASTALAAPQLSGDPLPFDLDETTVDGHEDHPGIDFERHPVSIFAAEAGGIATVDIDDDGFIDVFFTDTEGHSNHLYLNNGDGTYTESAAAFGIAETTKRRGSALFFDMENDGDLDLLSCGYPSQAIPNFDLYTLFENQGDPSYDFVDVTQSAGGFELAFLPEPTIIGEAGGITCGDVNGNGFLDVFVTYWNRSLGFYFDQPRLWISEDNPLPPGADPVPHSARRFSDQTAPAGLSEPIDGWLWTPTLIDLDRDGDLDLRINIDYGYDILRLNDGTGVFGPNIATDIGYNGTPAETRSEMGVAWGDIDFDGQLDSYHTNANKNDRLYINESVLSATGAGLAFQDYSPEMSTAVCNYGWGAVFADMDNDADSDLISVAGMAVGYVNHYHENSWPSKHPVLGVPVMVERSGGLPEFQKPGGEADVARNLSVFDHDNDGDLDVLVGRYGQGSIVQPGIRTKAGFFENRAVSVGNWLQVDLRERKGSRNVVSAQVWVRSGDRIQMREILGAGSSFMTQLPYRQHFGLGESTQADWICVRWADGLHQVGMNAPANQLLQVEKVKDSSTGDMNGDGVLDLTDLELLWLAIRRPGAYDGTYHWWPWQVVGDIDGNALLNSADAALLQAMLAG